MIIKDYSEAKKIFLHYNGSYFHMQREEYLDQYMKFNISKKEERKWLKEKVEKILSKMSEIKNINLKYDKYWNILYILTKTLEDNHLLDKTISAFEKDLKYCIEELKVYDNLKSEEKDLEVLDVKLADLIDNMSVHRLPEVLTDKDFARLQKYRLAYSKVKSARDKVVDELY